MGSGRWNCQIQKGDLAEARCYSRLGWWRVAWGLVVGGSVLLRWGVDFRSLMMRRTATERFQGRYSD